MTTLADIADVDTCCADSATAVLDADLARTAATVFKALADPVRLELYARIASRGEPVCVCDIQDVGVSQPTVSHHLKKLREAGLIECERRGTWVYYWPVRGALDVAGRVYAMAPGGADGV